MKIGIDLGGSHIAIGVINNEGFIVEKVEKRLLTKEKKDIKAAIESYIVKNVKELTEKYKVTEIGIAVPGTVCGTEIIKSVNLGVKNYNLVENLKKEIDLPIKIRNDAKCAAIAEKEFGSLKEYEDAVFLIIGTGVGGAVYLNGKLLRPKRYSGFEVGHTVINKNGIKCNCGRNGCFEVYSSMRRLKEKINKEFNLNTTDGIKIREFMEENTNNKKLDKILDEYIQNLETGIANLINIFEPQAISIGGSFGHYDILLKRLQDKINGKTELYNKEQIPKIVIAELKNDAGMIGAAMI